MSGAFVCVSQSAHELLPVKVRSVSTQESASSGLASSEISKQTWQGLVMDAGIRYSTY